MTRSNVSVRRALSVGVIAALAFAACGGATTSPSASGAAPSAPASPGASVEPSASTGGQAGGTAYLLLSDTQGDDFLHVDPQRVYTGEDLAFFGSTIQRSLVSYKQSGDLVEGNSLVPDLATDIGTPSADLKSWSFTLRDGVTWQDGTDVTCEDVKYGVSRTFATDIITDGPTFSINLLNIPTNEDGSSQYKGPYNGEGQELFDAAVTCDGKTITFNLKNPAADFNYTTTLGFSPVPKAADTGETYGSPQVPVVSNGPYKIESHTIGAGGKLILVRNENWDPASDPIRKAYPDRWEVHFKIPAKVLDQRLITSSGEDAFALGYSDVQPENLATVFADAETPNPDFATRATSAFDPYTIYYPINTAKVPNLKHRQAIMVALDRDALLVNAGGTFAGDYADGAVKPNIGQDYAPTGIWDTFFGKEIPPTGDPELAKQLIAESGEPVPELILQYPKSEPNDKAAAIWQSSLALAGMTVTPAPIETGYYGVILNPETSEHIAWGGWGPDWPNASTVIQPLFGVGGGFNVSQVNDPAFQADVDAALAMTDRAAQAAVWQDLNKRAVENAWIVPARFGRSQNMGGTNIGPLFRWAAYGSWPYGEIYVTP